MSTAALFCTWQAIKPVRLIERISVMEIRCGFKRCSFEEVLDCLLDNLPEPNVLHANISLLCQVHLPQQ